MIKRPRNKNPEQKKTTPDYNLNHLALQSSLEDNIRIFKGIFDKDDTFLMRYFINHQFSEIRCCIFYIDGMVDPEIVNKSVIQPVMNAVFHRDRAGSEALDEIQQKIVISDQVEKVSDINKMIDSVLYGDTLLLLDGAKAALIINTKGWKMRSIDEPQSERVVRGPREGFTESLLVNLSLLRRKIQTPDLKFQYREFGTRTRTKACICYLESIASQKILSELLKRLDDIQIDGMLDSGYIQELIKDSPYSPFKTIGNTERPDVVAGKLLEGRITVLVDGSPNALTLPYLFIEYFQVNEDYYNNYIYSTFNRWVRIIGWFLAVSVPAVYVALTTYQQEMIPTPLIMSISAARQNVPFPTIVEAILMLFVFDIIREPGTRLPTAIGQTVSIVGTLVLGQAAVEARIISAPMVIVIALAGITGYLIVKLKGATICIRYIFLLLSAALGLYGYAFGVFGLLIHLLGMRSFGVPYMLDIGSFNEQDIKDTVVRAPWWNMYLRPKLISARDRTRKSKQHG